MTRRPVVLCLAACAVVLCMVVTALVGAALLHGDPETTHPPHAERRDGATHPPPLAAVGGEVPEAVIQWIEGVAYAEWIEGVARAEWYAGVQADLDRQAREAAARAVPRSTGSSGRPGACDGIDWAIPVQLVIDESGCDFGAQSPSSFCGGHGCVGAYQFDSRHWDASSGWGGCADLGDWRDPEAQHECARRLSRGGTDYRPWGG